MNSDSSRCVKNLGFCVPYHKTSAQLILVIGGIQDSWDTLEMKGIHPT